MSVRIEQTQDSLLFDSANSLMTNRNDFYTLAVESKLVPCPKWVLKTLGQASNFREMNRSKPCVGVNQILNDNESSLLCYSQTNPFEHEREKAKPQTKEIIQVSGKSNKLTNNKVNELHKRRLTHQIGDNKHEELE